MLSYVKNIKPLVSYSEIYKQRMIYTDQRIIVSLLSLTESYRLVVINEEFFMRFVNVMVLFSRFYCAVTVLDKNFERVISITILG